MLWTIGIILLALWLLGFITASTFGGWIHVLLVIAIVVIVIQLLQGRRVL
ncbi:MAG: lmo0937 family membrane protein [Candidatus Moranbacteria bacterium]|nr:lmo0937 family membrane protein [Candidatus Moranbacteria bacterium]